MTNIVLQRNSYYLNNLVMRHLKFYFLLCSVFLFFGCSEYVSIKDASKTLNISGLSKGKNYIDYRLTVHTKKSITFENITLNGKVVKESLFLKDLNTGLSSTKIDANLPKGNYQFGFRKYNLTKKDIPETIALLYKIDGKLFTQKKEVILKTPKTNK